jgi:hypothetical protein
MIKSALGKVMWLGRATVFVVGLAVILALVVGVASTALGANGGNFILGSLNNTATAITKLTGTVGGGPALQVSNPSTATGSTALDLQVATGKAPMKVNRTTKVTNLNADKVDGKDAPLWAVINANGTIARSFGVTSIQKVGGFPGTYVVTFNRNVSNCAYIASLGDGAGNTFQGEVSATNNVSDANAVSVSTDNSSGVGTDRAFHLAVFC